MPRAKPKDYILDKEDPDRYHLKPAGSNVYTATIQRFMQNSSLRRWGVRPYNSPNEPWVTRGSKAEAITLALTLPVLRETSVVPTRQLIATARALYIARQALSRGEITRYTRAEARTTTRHLELFENSGWIELDRASSAPGVRRYQLTDSGREFARSLLDAKAAS